MPEEKSKKACLLLEPPEMTDELIERIIREGCELERILEARTKHIDRFPELIYSKEKIDESS